MKKHYVEDGFTYTTATNMFIRPILNIRIEDIKLHGFENAYMKDMIKDVPYEHAIYLLFRPMKIPEFAAFVERERKRGVLIDEYDYPEGWVMLVYKYPEKYEPDVQLIQEGRFSEVSYAFKKLIPDTSDTGLYGKQMSMQHHIFNKTAWIKQYLDATYGFEPDHDVEHWRHYPEREVFTEETLKNLI